MLLTYLQRRDNQGRSERLFRSVSYRWSARQSFLKLLPTCARKSSQSSTNAQFMYTCNKPNLCSSVPNLINLGGVRLVSLQRTGTESQDHIYTISNQRWIAWRQVRFLYTSSTDATRKSESRWVSFENISWVGEEVTFRGQLRETDASSPWFTWPISDWPF